jgi:hypothetical protein
MVELSLPRAQAEIENRDGVGGFFGKENRRAENEEKESIVRFSIASILFAILPEGGKVQKA